MMRFDADDASEPVGLFLQWLSEAAKTEPNDPDAVALATATASGAPSVRMVLVKHVDARGFTFYTNSESQKGHEIAANPRAAMCFHWKTQRRQVRAEGIVHQLPPQDAEAYFHRRSRGSQIGAAVSAQSRPLASRAELEQAARDLDAASPGEVRRPEYWRGYCLVPERVEFWQAGEYRLHDRIVFVRAGELWTKERLYP